MALSKGYTMVKIHEVWHWPDSMVGLFADYMDKMIKIKTQASGWPAGVETEDQKDAFVASFKAREGVDLAKVDMVKNAGLRQFAKLCLNKYVSELIRTYTCN